MFRQKGALLADTLPRFQARFGGMIAGKLEEDIFPSIFPIPPRPNTQTLGMAILILLLFFCNWQIRAIIVNSIFALQGQS
nr:hypothetical protein [Cohaesibacter sp. ES.047]